MVFKAPSVAATLFAAAFFFVRHRTITQVPSIGNRPFDLERFQKGGMAGLQLCGARML
jgi:hypothetical protein